MVVKAFSNLLRVTYLDRGKDGLRSPASNSKDFNDMNVFFSITFKKIVFYWSTVLKRYEA